MKTRTALFVSGLLLAAGLPLTWYVEFRKPNVDVVMLDRELKVAVPLELGGWTGQDLDLTEAEQEMLLTDDVLKRVYRHADGSVVSLFISYYGNRQKGMNTLFHNATVCYPAAGFDHVSTAFDEVVLSDLAKRVDVARYTFVRQSKRLSVLSFFRIDDEFLQQSPRNTPFLMARQKLKIFEDSAGSFVQVQVICDVRDEDDFRASQTQKRFLEAIGRPLFAAIAAPGGAQ